MRSWRHSVSLQRTISRILVYVLIIAGMIMFLFPLFWMISTSLKSNDQVFTYPIQWLPKPPLWHNYVEAWTEYYPFSRFLRNSLTIALGAILGNVISVPIVSYSFARLRWPGRDFFFFLVLFTMMVPYPVVMVPQFVLFHKLGWINTYLPFIVPAFLGGSGFYIFLMRQLIMTIPRELDEAARIDGCSTFGIYWRIILPLIKPGLVAIAIFEFIARWNDFLGPLIYLTKTDLFTLPLGLNVFRTQEGIYMNSFMAVSCVSIIPSMVLFFVAQKYFIQGIVITGLKG
ncbi:MAG: carbohydrate ABC transporter permease [Firmicutes bacterium]|nr:carbohydrate ABC transporter permease [Bacillota bacterium]